MKTSTLWKMLFKEWKDKSDFAKIYKEFLNLNNKKQPSLKNGKRCEQTPRQRKYTDGKWVYEKMLTIIYY